MNSKIPALTQASSPQSLDEFLKEMEKGPTTFKWDALLVFDRGVTNALLMQEYIDRIDIEDVWFPALPDGNVDVGNGIEHVLLGLILDKPRLSFENASIQDSKGKLQMRLVGGKRIEVIEKYLDGQPVRSIVALTVYNAATHGILDMNIRLEAVEGSVNSNGKVLLDLSNAFDHRFNGGGTEFERVQLGLYFQDVFDAWSDRNEIMTQFPLSEMVVAEGSPINPGVFGLRTHAAPGATVLGSEGYGDGAVIVFVAMRGSAPGSRPHNDQAMLYMLPEAATPYTSNLVFSQKFVVTHILKLAFEQLEMTKGRFDVEALPGERYKLVANSGYSHSEAVSLAKQRSGGVGSEYWENHLRLDAVNPVIISPGDQLRFEDRSVKGTFISNQPIGKVKATWSGKWGSGTDWFDLHANVMVDVSFKFVIKRVGQQARFFFEVDQFAASATFNIEIGSGSDKDRWREMAIEIQRDLEGIFRPWYEARFDEVKNLSLEIDALRLNNLLFRGENVVDPRDAALPTDLTLLGNLAPKRTSLVISPSEPIVASGQVIEFTAESELGGVTWKVENLPGEKGETGGFSASWSGRYTAPSDLALRAEGHRRLIVTATRGDLVSRVLVSVVPSQVTVNPWVAVVNVGMSHSLSAATPHPAGLTWDTPELGAVAPDDDLLNPGGYKYTAPVKLPQRQALDPLCYLALRLDPVTVHPAAGGPAATIDMLVVGTKNPNYWLEPKGLPDGSVELPFYMLDRDEGKVAVPEPVEWTVLRGSGIVDQATRVYKPAPNSSEQYVIIAAFYDFPGSVDTVDYVVLPMPLVPVRRYAEILNPAIKEVCDEE